MSKRVLVTGANGFAGRFVCRALIRSGFTPVAGLRMSSGWEELKAAIPGLCNYSLLGDLSAASNLRDHLTGISAVVHLAANTRMMSGESEALREYRRVNVEGTRSMALAAAAAGVRRFVFVSTAKVHGEGTTGVPFTEDTPANPAGPYAASKWQAEEALRAVASRTGMEVVVVRPPLVYGPGVRGNFRRLLRLVDRGFAVPLPRNGKFRSLIGVENLADFLVLCIGHREAANRSFLVTDGEDIAIRELIARLARLLARPTRIVTCPESLIRFAAMVAGREDAVRKMLDSFVVDSSRAQRSLGWTPPVSLDEGLSATARWFRESMMA